MNTGSFMKGAALGVTVGAITYALTNTSSKQRKRMKRTANKAMRSFGTLVDGISFMMR